MAKAIKHKKPANAQGADSRSVNNLEDIAEYLKNLKFRKRTLGGLDELDVWKKIRALDEMYQQLYRAQEIKYSALMELLGDESDD